MKLGAKFTEKPLECTHLIAVAFGRTEKLLASIAVAPFILREEWLTKSAAKGRFLRKSFVPLRARFFQSAPHQRRRAICSKIVRLRQNTPSR